MKNKRGENEQNIPIEKAQLEQILESIAEAIIVFSKDGFTLYVNKAAKNILGREKSDIIGQRYDNPRRGLTTEKGEKYPP